MRFAIALVLLAGCYRPSAKPGAPCSADLMCPTGQVCDTTMAPPTCVLSVGSVDGPIGGDAADDAFVPPPDAPQACGTNGVCAADSPVCDPNGTYCRGCNADLECPSHACNEYNAACMDEAVVIYVAPTGNDAGPCTRLAPCATLATAVEHVTATRNFIAIAAGSYSGHATMTNLTATISGAAWDASLSTISYDGGGAGYVLDVVGGGITVETLTFSGGTSGVVRATGGYLGLGSVEVTSSSGGSGVTGIGAELDLYGIGASSNAEHGITASGGSLAMDGCYIDSNGTRAVAIANADYNITNTIITSNAGGVSISEASTPATAIFDFNSVVANTTTGAYQGLTSTSPVKVTNSIFAGNGNAPQVTTNAGITYSLFDDVAPSGTGNVAGDPMFQSSPWDLHIKLGSAAHDAADPAATLDHDYDWDTRPHHGRSDIGCDEY